MNALPERPVCQCLAVFLNQHVLDGMQVLKKVMQHEIAESFFNEPVDPDALGIPEYREIIRVRQARPPLQPESREP